MKTLVGVVFATTLTSAALSSFAPSVDVFGELMPVSRSQVAVVHYVEGPVEVAEAVFEAGATQVYSNAAHAVAGVTPVTELVPPTSPMVQWIARSERGRGVVRLEASQLSAGLLQGWTVVMDGHREGPPPASAAAAVVATDLSGGWLAHSRLVDLLTMSLVIVGMLGLAAKNTRRTILLSVFGLPLALGLVFSLRSLGLVISPVAIVAAFVGPLSWEMLSFAWAFMASAPKLSEELV